MAKIHLYTKPYLSPGVRETNGSGEKSTEIPDELWSRYEKACDTKIALESEIYEYVERARRASSWADAEEDD